MVLFSFLLATALTKALADENRCGALQEPPRNLQVAWISPVRKRVGRWRYLEVVRVADLRVLSRQHGGDATRVLQAVGMVGHRGGGLFTPKHYKVTFFDVESDWLCRPVEGQTPGTVIRGVKVCPRPQQTGNRFYTGCGYTKDTVTSGRSIDVYRIRWSDASRWGFCVMPLERFLAGA